jgi:uncharacterized protein YaiI (UPF0178 family)
MVNIPVLVYCQEVRTEAEAIVIGNNGRPFTTTSIGGITGGPAPFAKADRSRFLQALDEALVRLG